MEGAIRQQSHEIRPGAGPAITAQNGRLLCDNARYYRAKAVQEYLKSSRIKLVFLPPYAPNLNLIERLWKFFKKNILYNRYYESFDEFTTACEEFFSNPRKYHRELRSLLTENFAIVG